MQSADLAMLRDIPGYKIIMKAVIKHQIQQLVRHEAFHKKILAATWEILFSGFSTRSDTNWAVQLQKMARGLGRRGIVLCM